MSSELQGPYHRVTGVRVPPLWVSGARPLEEVVGTEPFGEIQSCLSQGHIRDRGRPQLAGSAHSRGGRRARVPANPDAPSHLPASCRAPGAGGGHALRQGGVSRPGQGAAARPQVRRSDDGDPVVGVESSSQAVFGRRGGSSPASSAHCAQGSVFPDASCPRLPSTRGCRSNGTV